MEKQKFNIENLNGKRQLLAEKLPLKVPFSISVTTANVCNLKCEFCAISEAGRKKNKSFLDIETFELAMSSLLRCKWHLKQIVLVGLGEPLLNKNIVYFVKYIKENNISDKVHIVTNAVPLNKILSDSLIDANLDICRISINGLSSDDYLKYTGVKIDFDNLVNNIAYLYKNKNSNLQIYIKIMDYMVDTDKKKELFYKIFKDICDVINIEYVTEMSTTLDYSNVTDKTSQKGLKGFRKRD